MPAGATWETEEATAAATERDTGSVVPHTGRAARHQDEEEEIDMEKYFENLSIEYGEDIKLSNRKTHRSKLIDIERKNTYDKEQEMSKQLHLKHTNNLYPLLSSGADEQYENDILVQVIDLLLNGQVEQASSQYLSAIPSSLSTQTQKYIESKFQFYTTQKKKKL